ncbi:MAG: thiamine biosynthesis protein ThiC [Cellvibrionaceae bacterium]|nr:thiamine biosynthesis protein ThiC [Cellvibrionaceae bacterium]
MNFTPKQLTQFSAYILLVLALTQVVYTALYVAKLDVPRQFLWGSEGLLFTLLIAFAGAAMVQLKENQLIWSAIAFSAVLNVIQVSVGITLFGSFSEAASEVTGLKPALSGVVALSFMIYYAAKLLLGIAALGMGSALMSEGSKALGGLTALVGGIAVLANAILITFGRDGFLPSSVAGATGVLATLLLALCLIVAARKTS